MPKRVSEEWASLLYNDKVCITIDDKNQVLLDDALASNRFNYKFSELIERVFALGIGATVVFADAKGKPRIDYIIAVSYTHLDVYKRQYLICLLYYLHFL